MAQKRLIEATCDRCDITEQLPELREFQAVGWRTISNKVFGSSDDHDSRTNLDLCDRCATEMADFLFGEAES